MRQKLPLNKRGSRNSKKWRIQVEEISQKSESEVSVPSEVYDSGAKSSRVVNNNDFTLTDKR